VLVQVENDHGKVVVFAQADCRCVHYFQATFDDFHVGDLLEHRGVFDKKWIGIVDTIDFCSLQYDVGLDFHGAQGCCGIGGEVRISRSGAEDHNAILLKMPHRATADEGFGHLIHLDGGHYAGMNVLLLERIL
jgi:hypothetical protein